VQAAVQAVLLLLALVAEDGGGRAAVKLPPGGIRR
jgi:hypothetical protein